MKPGRKPGLDFSPYLRSVDNLKDNLLKKYGWTKPMYNRYKGGVKISQKNYDEKVGILVNELDDLQVSIMDLIGKRKS